MHTKPNFFRLRRPCSAPQAIFYDLARATRGNHTIKHPYRAPQAKNVTFSMLYKGKSYSFIHKNTQTERRRRKFLGL